MSDRKQNFDRYSYILRTYYLFFLYIKFIREAHMQSNLRYRALQNVAKYDNLFARTWLAAASPKVVRRVRTFLV